jgi:hypothetical protein
MGAIMKQLLFFLAGVVGIILTVIIDVYLNGTATSFGFLAIGLIALATGIGCTRRKGGA